MNIYFGLCHSFPTDLRGAYRHIIIQLTRAVIEMVRKFS